MGNWYENNRKLFREERIALAAAFPLLQLVIVGPEFRINSHFVLKHEFAVVQGTYSLCDPNLMSDIEYKIVLVFPPDYPKNCPVMYCNDPKLPIGNIDRHIMGDGSACLGVKGEIAMRWQSNRTLVHLLKDFVEPFLVWQACYDIFQKPPEWGERSHLGPGILEFYAELLNVPVDSNVAGFMKLLARKNQPKGHEICPCDSGQRLRNCHRELVYANRLKVPWLAVQQDLEVLNRV
jgi:hypothetical protein